MPEGWLGSLAAAVAGGAAAWLLIEHLGRRPALVGRRLRRMTGLTDTSQGGRESAVVRGLTRIRLSLATAMPAQAADSVEAQLEQLLVTMAMSLRAGLSLSRALEVASRETARSMRLDLDGVLAEYRVGRPLEECLAAWGHRRRSRDIAFLAQALGIHRESGGDLVVMLSNLAETLRERRLLRLELAAKTSEARVTAAVLVGMVPLLAVYLAVFHPILLQPLVRYPLGRLGLAYAFLSWLLGAYLSGRLVRLPEGGS